MWCITAALIGRHINARLGASPADLLERLPGAAATGRPPEFIGPRPVGTVNILLLGKDERPDEIKAENAGRTDTLMVLRVDFDHGRAGLLSISRDMTVALPNLEAHSTGFPGGLRSRH
jgi:hypothetical protein